jgi:hypothetical protein
MGLTFTISLIIILLIEWLIDFGLSDGDRAACGEGGEEFALFISSSSLKPSVNSIRFRRLL